MAKTLDRGLENREIVLDILTEVLEQGAFVQPCTEQDPARSTRYLGKADRSFITRAVEGTLEYLIQIDEVINRYFQDKNIQDEAVHPQSSADERIPDFNIWTACRIPLSAMRR